MSERLICRSDHCPVCSGALFINSRCLSSWNLHRLRWGLVRERELHKSRKNLSVALFDTLMRVLPLGICAIEDVAGYLGMTSRTLQRKLCEEETSFRAELFKARKELALEMVFDPSRSVYEIAQDLCYSEVNSFRRAFIQWTGKSFSAYRLEKLNEANSQSCRQEG